MVQLSRPCCSVTVIALQGALDVSQVEIITPVLWGCGNTYPASLLTRAEPPPQAAVVIALPSSRGAFLEQIAHIPIFPFPYSKPQGKGKKVSELSVKPLQEDSARCTLALSSVSGAGSAEPLEGVLSSQMIIHVYMEIKIPGETSAMTGSGSVHIHRETQALSLQLMILVESSLRQFGNAFPV